MHERETRKPRFWPRQRSQRHAANLLLALLLATRLANARAFLPALDCSAADGVGMAAATSGSSDRAPREVIVVIEHSASMRGWRFARALRQAQRELAGLRTTDRFNLVVYADHTDVLYARPAPALAANIAQAQQWLRTLRTGGAATQRQTALQYATWVPGVDGYAREIVLADASSDTAAADDSTGPDGGRTATTDDENAFAGFPHPSLPPQAGEGDKHASGPIGAGGQGNAARCFTLLVMMALPAPVTYAGNGQHTHYARQAVGNGLDQG